MAKKKRKKPALSEKDQVQLQMLLDRLVAQDPEGETFGQFLETLIPLVSNASPFTLAFVDALGEMASPTAVKVLQALQEIPAEKRVRRAVKSALYRLERRGLVPGAKPEEGKTRVLVPRPAERRAESWVSWPESTGDRGIVLQLPASGRGYLLVIAVLNPERGFQDFQASQATRKEIKNLVKELSGQGPAEVVAVPVSHLRFLFEEAAQIHRNQNLDPPAEYQTVQGLLSHWVETPVRPHVYELLDAEEVARDPALLRASESLLESPPISFWNLREELVQPYAEKIKELGGSRLIVSRGTRLERIQRLIREAAAEIFTPPVRQFYRRLLEESALLFCLQGRIQEGRRALAAALDLTRQVGFLTENTFVLALLRRSLGEDVLRELEGGEQEASAERTSESGLIIP